MSRNCSKCGATVPDTATFCRVCGQKLEPKRSPVPQKCRTCGTLVPAGKQYCTKCGTRVPSRPAPEPSTADATTTTTATATTEQQTCPHCGHARNPASAKFCTKCGNPLSSSTPVREVKPLDEPSPTPTGKRTCPNCSKPVKASARFCTSCGSKLTDSPPKAEPSETEAPVASIDDDTTSAAPTHEPIKLPVKVFSSLATRGEQLALEEQYAEGKTGDEKILDGLSKAAEDGGYPLEEFVDTYVRERSEQERLEELLESGEVSERVYSRLTKEYNEKLLDLEEKIKEGRTQLLGYLAQLQSDLAKAEEKLDTIETRIRIGDEKDLKTKRKKLVEKIKKFRLAITAAVHILNKEGASRGGSPIRFEISEKTLTESETSESSSPEEAAETPPPAEPTTDIEGGKICPSCGHITAADAKFCTRCSQRL